MLRKREGENGSGSTYKPAPGAGVNDSVILAGILGASRPASRQARTVRIVSSRFEGLVAGIAALDSDRRPAETASIEQKGNIMPAGSRAMIFEAERRFPVRVRLAVPASGLGRRLDAMHDWLNQNCGADGWLMTPAGRQDTGSDAVAIYFRDAVLATAFVARWCRRQSPDIAEGAFLVREDDPAPPRLLPLHKTP